MPVPVMVRFDDDLAEKLRERAHDERTSINRLINDVMRRYVEADSLSDDKASDERLNIASNLQKQLKEFRKTLQALERRQENPNDYVEPLRNAVLGMGHLLQLVVLGKTPESVPTIQTKSSQKSHSEEFREVGARR